MDRYDIMRLIEEEVKADIHFDLSGQDRVADSIMSYIEGLKSKIAELEDDADLLSCLRAAGVDNWDGYDYAIELYEER